MEAPGQLPSLPSPKSGAGVMVRVIVRDRLELGPAVSLRIIFRVWLRVTIILI